MKRVYKNWRCVALIAMGVMTFLLAVAESDSLRTLVLTKVLSIVCCVVCYHLGRKWAREGKLDELTNL